MENKRMSDAELMERLVEVGAFPTPVNDQITDAVIQTIRWIVEDHDLFKEVVLRRMDRQRDAE